MFEHFTLRHLVPLVFASIWTFGGTYSFTFGPESALLALGLRKEIASSKSAWPVIKLEGSRISTLGMTIWGLYLGGHLEAVDTVLSCIGWIALVDCVVLSKEGAPGWFMRRTVPLSGFVLWGLLGMTSGKYF